MRSSITCRPNSKQRGDPWRLNEEAPAAKPPIDMIGLRIGRKASPDTPQPTFPFLSPGLPGRGLSWFGEIASEIGRHAERGAIAGAYIGAMIEPPAKSGAGLFGFAQ